MDMTGEYRIPAPRQRVWEALNDPEILKAAIPGCEELNKLSDRELEARVRAKVGPVSATFNGKVTLGDLNPPESYTISGEGKGGAAGFAKGGAEVRLAEDGPATVLRYNAKADVGGKLAQIGSRLIQGTAKKMADDFFGKFSKIVGERHGSEAAAAAPAPGAEPATGIADGPAPPPRSFEPAKVPETPVTPAVPSPATATPPAEAAPAGAAMAAAATGTPAPQPRPQVAFGPEPQPTPPATRPAETPPAASTGLMQQWWVWLIAALVVVALAFVFFGNA